MKLLTTIVLILGGLAVTKAERKDDSAAMADCPMMGEHAAMNARGNRGMGFSQEKTSHHFRWAADGGTIEVSTNDAKDAPSRAQIRQHLGHIARMFQQGNFQIPMFVHGKMPTGASAMQQHKRDITYQYQETETGGLVRIRTRNRKALEAVHQFLRFQIEEHRTGDPTS